MSTVRDLVKAADKNRRLDLVVSTQSTSVAVLHGLDQAFNKGKAKILSKYQRALMASDKKTKNIKQAANTIFGVLNNLNQKAREKRHGS